MGMRIALLKRMPNFGSGLWLIRERCFSRQNILRLPTRSGAERCLSTADQNQSPARLSAGRLRGFLRIRTMRSADRRRSTVLALRISGRFSSNSVLQSRERKNRNEKHKCKIQIIKSKQKPKTKTGEKPNKIKVDGLLFV